MANCTGHRLDRVGESQVCENSLCDNMPEVRQVSVLWPNLKVHNRSPETVELNRREYSIFKYHIFPIKDVPIQARRVVSYLFKTQLQGGRFILGREFSVSHK